MTQPRSKQMQQSEDAIAIYQLMKPRLITISMQIPRKGLKLTEEKRANILVIQIRRGAISKSLTKMLLMMLKSKNQGYLLPSALSARFVRNLTIRELVVDTMAVEVSFKLQSCGLPVKTRDLNEFDYLLKQISGNFDMLLLTSQAYVSTLVIVKSLGRSISWHWQSLHPF